MDCPVCKRAMLVVEYEGIELDHCVECNGTWFDREELELLLERFIPDIGAALPADVASAPEAAAREARRRCPLCRRRMRKTFLGREDKVLIDVCPRGEGMWFDSEEVTRLATDLSRTGNGTDGASRTIEFLGGLFGGSGAREDNGREE